MIKRSDLWRKQYNGRRYLQFVKDEELAQRLRDVINNQITLTGEGKIGLRSLERGGAHWIELFAHIQEEYLLRGQNIPNDILRNVSLPRPTWPKAPVGSKLAQKIKELNRGAYLIKFSKSQYLREVLQGKIRISPASSYRDPSLNTAIQDNELKMTIYGLPSEVTITHAESNTQIKPIGNIAYHSQCSIDYYVYCISDILDIRLFNDFEADSCLIIKNPEVFARLLNEAMLKHLPDWTGMSSRVGYIDPLNARTNEPVVFFTKHFRYAYQSEHRFIWLPPPAAKIQSLEPIILQLNGLADITECIDLHC